jgi:tetratricopeptide (TPR) repeat protein
MYGALMLLVYGAGGAAALGAGSSAMINRGNRAFQQGDFEEAFEYYERAEEENPLSPRPLYNQGTVLYMQGNYHAALEAFKKVNPQSGELSILATYNQGNSLARIGELEEKSNPTEALEYYWDSIGAYRRTLSLDPDFWDAAHNIEVVKYRIRNLLAMMEMMSGGEMQEDAESGRIRDEDGTDGASPQEGDERDVMPDQSLGEESEPLDETARDILNDESERRAEQNLDGVRSNADKDW